MAEVNSIWRNCASVLALGLFAIPASAADVTLVLKDHTFKPRQLEVPANEAINLTVDNLDPAPAELESKELRLEKALAGKSRIVVHLRPLPKGRYRLFDDYHESTAEAFLTVK